MDNIREQSEQADKWKESLKELIKRGYYPVIQVLDDLVIREKNEPTTD